MTAAEHLLKIVKLVIPSDAEIEILRSSGVRFRIFWYMNDDPSRTRKQSRNLLLSLPEELVDDYPSMSKSERSSFDVQLSSEIEKVISGFDKQSDHSKYETPPSETWVCD